MRSGVVHTLPLVEQKSDPSSESRAFHDRSCVSAAAPFRFFSRPPLLARSLALLLPLTLSLVLFLFLAHTFSTTNNQIPPPLPLSNSQIFDDVWAQFTKLGSPLGTSYSPSAYAPNSASGGRRGASAEAAAFDELAAFAAAAGEFETPEAANTRVAVIGATGRVGRVLVRKLLLRGYKVTALVRPPAGMPLASTSSSSSSSDDASDATSISSSSTSSMEPSLEPSSVGLPDAVRVVWGDVGDYAALRKAVDGADKVVFAAAARTLLSADVSRVDAAGVAAAAAALQDSRAVAAARAAAAAAKAAGGAAAGAAPPARAPTAKRTLFEKKSFEGGDFVVEHCGPPSSSSSSSSGEEGKRPNNNNRNSKAAAADRASLSVNERGNLVFEGVVRSRGGAYAQATAPLPAGASSLAEAEGLVVRVAADGGSYTVVLRTAAGELYGARVSAPVSFANLRLPFAAFRPLSAGAPPQLDPATATHFGIRFSPPTAAVVAANTGSVFSTSDENLQVPGAFRIEIDRVKALPGGTEPDFILLSASAAGAAAVALGAARGGGGGGGAGGASSSDRGTSSSFASSSSSSSNNTAVATAAAPATAVLASIDDAADEAALAAAAERLLASKREGEAALRRSGLGYVVVRPGPLLEEPGGYRALVFDQGNRIARGISCADAADVCLKALHDPLARNKTFEVCYEYEPEAGLEQYELLAHLPDKANNYLSPALAVLEKNT